MQNQGLQQYNQLIPTVSGTQTVRPETQIGVAEQNALNRAAPDPGQAASYAQILFDRYLNSLSRPSSPAAGTGSYAAPIAAAAAPPATSRNAFQPSNIAPTGPGWGILTDNQGGSWSTGNVPASVAVPGVPIASPFGGGFDTNFDFSGGDSGQSPYYDPWEEQAFW
jgi:hypothetical protein